MPILSGFLPIPLAMMIPFMGAQSLVLGKQFGEGFQYGKRKISAMSNEEFNKMTPAKLAADNAAELKQMIPSMQQSITDMRTFQSFIIRELIATVKQLPSDIFGGLTEGKDPHAHLEENPFGLGDLANLLKGAATQQFIGYGPKGGDDHITHTEETFTPPEETIEDTRFRYPKNAGTFAGKTIQEAQKRMDQMKLIDVRRLHNFTENTDLRNAAKAWLDRNKPRVKTAAEIKAESFVKISETATGWIKQLADYMVQMTYFLGVIKVQKSRLKPNLLYISNSKKNFLINAKAYNQVALINRQKNIVDTAKSLGAAQIVTRPR